MFASTEEMCTLGDDFADSRARSSFARASSASSSGSPNGLSGRLRAFEEPGRQLGYARDGGVVEDAAGFEEARAWRGIERRRF